VDEQEGLGAFGEDGDRFARSDGLETASDLGGVELVNCFAVGEDFNGLEGGIAAGEVGDS